MNDKKKTDYTLRKATDEDNMLSFEIRRNALGEYVKQTWGWDEQMQLKIHNEDFNKDILSIIEVNGEPAGSLEYYFDEHSMIISGIYIIERFQNLGIGEDILLQLQKEAASKKTSIRLQVLKVNHRAFRFYVRLGYRLYNTTETHYQMNYTPDI